MGVAREFKKTDIGIIPEDWEPTTIENLKIEVGDGIHSTPKYTSSGDYYFINGNNLINGKIILDNETKRINQSEFKKHAKGLKVDKTILLSINGTIGNVAYYKDEPVLLGKSAAYLNVSEKCYRSFLFYALQSNTVVRQFEDGLTGSTIRNLGLGIIRQTKIPLPLKIKEQESIANALSDADAYIESLEKLIAKKRLIKKGVMQELLTGKKRLSGFGGKWITRRLNELCTYQNGKALESYFNGQSGKKVISIGNYSSEGKFIPNNIFIDDLMYPQVQGYVLNKNDLALLLNDKTSSGTIIGRAIFIEADSAFIFNQRTMRITSRGAIAPRYLWFALNCDHYHQRFVKLAKPGTQIYVNTIDVLDFEISFPEDKNEQLAISEILLDMDSGISSHEEKIEKARLVKQGMMQELLTGRIRLV